MVSSNNSYSVLKDSTTGRIINPTVWYKFNNSANIGFDSSGNGCNMTTNVNVTTATGVKGNICASYNDTTSYSCNINVNLNQKDFSISYWVNLTNTNANYVFSRNSTGETTLIRNNNTIYLGHTNATNVDFSFFFLRKLHYFIEY